MSVLSHPARILRPDQLLWSKHKLTLPQKLVMTLWGVVLAQLANPVANAIYFATTQIRYTFSVKDGVGFVITYPKAANEVYATLGLGHPAAVGWGVYLGDLWDRLPVHAANVLHVHVVGLGSLFTMHIGQAAPSWWVTCRHDLRYVLAGTLAVLMVKMVTVGLGHKEHEPVSKARILASPVVIPVCALAAAVIPIVFFAAVWPHIPGVSHIGLLSGNAYFGAWVGSGKWELVLIGLFAGFAVTKPLFTPVAASVQLISIDKKLAAGKTPQRWWHLVFTPAYRERFEYLQEKPGYVPAAHGKALGRFLAVGSFVFVVLLAFGIWLRYFGPAKGA